MKRDYSKGKIYCIRSHSTDVVYIGSTTNNLACRMAQHRQNYKNYLNGKYHYVSSFKIIEHGDAYIELVEDCPCETKEQLERREGQIMRETANRVNKRIEGRTEKEYYEENKEQIAERNKKKYEENKEQIVEQQKKYREANKEQIAEQQKKWREANKEHMAERNKKYYEANKEKLKQKYTCECGSVFRIDSKSRHMKTKKHQNFINK
jgi:hypothetical protein